MSAVRYTAVAEIYRKNRINYRVVFGNPLGRVRRGWRRKLAIFKPGQVVGYQRWQANRYGTQGWTFEVGKCVAEGAATRLPGVLPGVNVWLSAKGKTQVKAVFAALDAMEAREMAPENVPERRWRELQVCINLGRNNAGAVVEGWRW